MGSGEASIAGPRHGARAGVLLIAVLVLLATACATRPYRYEPIDAVDFRSRAKTQQSGNLRVTAAVPSADESKALFGIPVYRRGIQPIWIEVENSSSKRVRFAPVGVDRTYFSPLEVAYMHRKLFSKRGHQDMERRFHEIAMPRQIWPGETRSGFVFTHVSPGTKGFNVDLFSTDEDDSFTFFLDVPGFMPDHAEVDFRRPLHPRARSAITTWTGFRAALAEIGLLRHRSERHAAGPAAQRPARRRGRGCAPGAAARGLVREKPSRGASRGRQGAALGRAPSGRRIPHRPRPRR